MAWTYYPLARLGAGKAGLTGTLGYRLIDSGGVTVVTFTTAGVGETSVPGNYVVAGGVSMPDGFRGRVEWGVSATKYAEEEINPQTAENTDLKTSSRLAPTAAGKTLDVSDGGEAGIDWSNIGSTGSVVSLPNTSVGSAGVVGNVTNPVAVSGTVSANVTQVVGNPAAAAALFNALNGDAGNVPLYVTLPDSTSQQIATLVWVNPTRTLTSTTTITQQAVRDAMLLAPSGFMGTPQPGSLDAKVDAVKAKTDLIVRGKITVVQPPVKGKVYITRGTVYSTAHGNALIWSLEDLPSGTDYAGMDCLLEIDHGSLVAPGVFVDGVGFVVELSYEQSIVVGQGSFEFNLVALAPVTGDVVDRVAVAGDIAIVRDSQAG